MTKINKKNYFLSAVALVALFLPMTVFASSYKASVGAVAKFGPESEDRCCSSCDDRPINYDWQDVLVDHLEDWDFASINTPKDRSVDHDEWADYDKDDEGYDNSSPNGVDSYHIGMVLTHGGSVHSSSSGYYSYFYAGDPSTDGECQLHYGRTSENDVTWGDGTLRYVFLKSCNSVDYEVWEHGGYSDHDDSSNAQIRDDNLRMMAGFHGSHINYSGEVSRWDGYLDNVEYNGIGEDWVDEMTWIKTGSNNDNCAVAQVWADDEYSADQIYEGGGFNDMQSEHNGSGVEIFYGWENCDPSDGPSLPEARDPR